MSLVVRGAGLGSPRNGLAEPRPYVYGASKARTRPAVPAEKDDDPPAPRLAPRCGKVIPPHGDRPERECGLRDGHNGRCRPVQEHPLIGKTCEACGGEFQTRNPRTRSCSPPCSAAVRNRDRAAERGTA